MMTAKEIVAFFIASAGGGISGAWWAFKMFWLREYNTLADATTLLVFLVLGVLISGYFGYVILHL